MTKVACRILLKPQFLNYCMCVPDVCVCVGGESEDNFL